MPESIPSRPGCWDLDCYELAVVLVSRSVRSRLIPVCDRHAHEAVLLGERFGYPVVIQGLHSEHAPTQRPAG